MTVELTVDRIVAGGDGLADLDGLKVFVPFSAPGERIRASLVTRKRDYAVARIDDIIEPSPLRVTPECPHFGTCGGCQLQHLSYEGQLVAKKLIVNDALQRLGDVFVPIRNVEPSNPEWRYRNKTQYPVGWSRGVRVGFFRRGSHRLLDIDRCLLHPERFDRFRLSFVETVAASNETIYDEWTHRGNIRHLVLRCPEPGGETLAIVVTSSGKLAGTVVNRLAAEEGVAGVVQSVNPTRTNRILGPRSPVLAGRGHLLVPVLDREFRVSAGSFFQVNSDRTAALSRKVLKYLAPGGDECVVDLFSGVGVLSLVVARFVDSVVGVELDPVAVADAAFNAQRNGIDNARFIAGDVDAVITGLERTDAVIIDPPRRGCEPETLRRIAGLKPSRIIYVSCHPATLARDLKILAGHGYRTTDVEPVDMFPQTFHVEVIARLEPDS